MSTFSPGEITIPRGHLIAGVPVDGGGERRDVRRPSDGQVYADIGIAGEEIVDRAVGAALRAFRTSDWASRPPRGRGAALRRWADLIDADARHLGPIEALGSTRPIGDVLSGDIPHLTEAIRFYAEMADKHGGDVAATGRDSVGFTVLEPHGVVAAILPWNFPLAMAGWKLAPALAAGNAVVVKPSEFTPFSILRLVELAAKAGIPEGILNVVQGTGAVTGGLLVRHPGIAKITFTGSVATGAAIMAASAAHGLKPVTLELGGKSPQIIFDDADIALAASRTARAILSNAGQECVAGSRLIVHRAVAEGVVERIANLMRAARPRPTWDAGCSYSPIIAGDHLARIADTVARATAAGAEIRCGGAAFEAPHGAFFQPTILTGATAGNPAVTQEIFGPVLTVQTFESEEEAVAMANDSNLALAAGLYTRDLSRALRVQKALEAGTVWINRYGRSDDFIIPTGGFKHSGFGKDLGREAFLGNLRQKSVLVDIAPAATAAD